ncbi:MAG TPA: hypothetical protein H9809_07140, partial [Candidatus Blautia pullicola]|nr:hypothetical protein [Candidatus Blautia pullicola]
MILFAAVGMRDAITPIVSFNFGMKNKKRIREGIIWGLFFTGILMAIGMIVIELAASPLTKFFSLSDLSYYMCIDCIRIMSLAFLFAGLCIAFQGVFQGIECGIESLLIFLGRQMVFIPFLTLLPTRRISSSAFAIFSSMSVMVTISILISGIRKAGSPFRDFLLGGATVRVAVIKFYFLKIHFLPIVHDK